MVELCTTCYFNQGLAAAPNHSSLLYVLIHTGGGWFVYVPYLFTPVCLKKGKPGVGRGEPFLLQMPLHSYSKGQPAFIHCSLNVLWTWQRHSFSGLQNKVILYAPIRASYDRCFCNIICDVWRSWSHRAAPSSGRSHSSDTAVTACKL